MSSYRTLIRVEKVNKQDGVISIIIPAWSSTEEVQLTINTLPPVIRECIFEGQIYLHAVVNFSVDNADELIFDRWERD